MARETRFRLKRRRRGAATVEFALVLPLLLALLFGIIEFGLLFKDQLSIQQAAREGARTAAVGRVRSEVINRINNSVPTLTTASLTSDITYRTYSGGTWSGYVTLGDKADGNSNDAPPGAQVRVRTNYTHRFATGSLFARLIGRPGATSMNLHAEMVMRRE